VPELHLDQNIPRDVATYLQQLGYAVFTATALSMRKAEDAEHLLRAALDGRVVITKDKDYLVLQVAWRVWPPAWQVAAPLEHVGVLVIHDHWPSQQAAQEIHQALCSGWPLRNALYRWETRAACRGRCASRRSYFAP
jgi:hypothetical protein